MTAQQAHVCVVLHDVADARLAACERLVAAVCEVAPVPMTLLAVPRFHHLPASRSVVDWLTERARQGDELALHGLTHLDDGRPRDPVDWLRRRHYTRGEGEFWALDEREATRRLRIGQQWFAENGWSAHGFVAPAWLMGPGAWAAIRRFDFGYTCTLAAVHTLRAGEVRHVEHSQSLVYSTSTAWRRASSLLWNGTLARRLRTAPLLRLELHPHDADHPAVRRSWQRLLARALESRRAATLARFAATHGA